MFVTTSAVLSALSMLMLLLRSSWIVKASMFANHLLSVVGSIALLLLIGAMATGCWMYLFLPYLDSCLVHALHRFDSQCQDVFSIIEQSECFFRGLALDRREGFCPIAQLELSSSPSSLHLKCVRLRACLQHQFFQLSSNVTRSNEQMMETPNNIPPSLFLSRLRHTCRQCLDECITVMHDPVQSWIQKFALIEQLNKSSRELQHISYLSSVYTTKRSESSDHHSMEWAPLQALGLECQQNYLWLFNLLQDVPSFEEESTHKVLTELKHRLAHLQEVLCQGQAFTDEWLQRFERDVQSINDRKTSLSIVEEHVSECSEPGLLSNEDTKHTESLVLESSGTVEDKTTTRVTTPRSKSGKKHKTTQVPLLIQRQDRISIKQELLDVLSFRKENHHCDDNNRLDLNMLGESRPREPHEKGFRKDVDRATTTTTINRQEQCVNIRMELDAILSQRPKYRESDESRVSDC